MILKVLSLSRRKTKAEKIKFEIEQTIHCGGKVKFKKEDTLLIAKFSL